MRLAHVCAAVLLLASLASACAQPAPPPPPPDTRAADEAAVRTASAQWLAAGQAKDAARFTSFFAPDGMVLFHGAPTVAGRNALDAMGVEMMKDPAFAISWKITKVEVARSGDIAHEFGTWEMTATSAATKQPGTDHGDYVTLWKKQTDGSWKVVADVPVSTAPPANR